MSRVGARAPVRVAALLFFVRGRSPVTRNSCAELHPPGNANRKHISRAPTFVLPVLMTSFTNMEIDYSAVD